MYTEGHRKIMTPPVALIAFCLLIGSLCGIYTVCEGACDPFFNEEWEGACYHVSSVTYNQADASTFCNNHDAHLIFIETAEEQAAMAGFLSYSKGYWIGLIGTSTSDVKWLNGESPEYTNFEASSFDDQDGFFRLKTSFATYPHIFYWHDWSPTDQLYVICELGGPSDLSTIPAIIAEPTTRGISTGMAGTTKATTANVESPLETTHSSLSTLGNLQPTSAAVHTLQATWGSTHISETHGPETTPLATSDNVQTSTEAASTSTPFDATSDEGMTTKPKTHASGATPRATSGIVQTSTDAACTSMPSGATSKEGTTTKPDGSTTRSPTSSTNSGSTLATEASRPTTGTDKENSQWQFGASASFVLSDRSDEFSIPLLLSFHGSTIIRCVNHCLRHEACGAFVSDYHRERCYLVGHTEDDNSAVILKGTDLLYYKPKGVNP